MMAVVPTWRIRMKMRYRGYACNKWSGLFTALSRTVRKRLLQNLT